MKLSARTVMKIARLYDLADDTTPLKALRNLTIHDGESFVRATFTLNKQRYGLCYGSVVDEGTLDELWPDRPASSTLLPNPLDPDSRETPFQGKFVVLLHLPARTQRLDQFLATQFDPSRSRNQWQQHIKAGHVSVNGHTVSQPRREVSDTDDIAATFPEPPHSTQQPDILYQDQDVVVFNKPSGLLTHAKGGIIHEPTVADAARPLTSFAIDSDRPGIVHRLDRDTSGVLITARTPEAAIHLQQQFAQRRADKTYLAIITGQPRHRQARIQLPIGRHPQKPSTFRVDPNGKPAETAYQVLATNGDYSLVKLQPKTGRTHQLRVHLHYLGTPILGDRIYAQPAERLYLHAYRLRILLPSGATHTFTAPLPAAFYQYFPEVTLP